MCPNWAHAYVLCHRRQADLRLARRAERGPGRGSARSRRATPTARCSRATSAAPARVLPALDRRADDGTDADGCERRHRQAARPTADSRPARPGPRRTSATRGSSASRTQFTIAVWVGYPDATTPMKTEFGGEPVAGGTYPALVWRNFVLPGQGDPRTARGKAKGATTRRTAIAATRAPALVRSAADTDTHAGARDRQGRRHGRRRQGQEAGHEGQGGPPAPPPTRRTRATPTPGSAPSPRRPTQPDGRRRRGRRRQRAAGLTRRRRHVPAARREPGGQRPRHEPACPRAEPPGQLDGVGDADPRAGDDLRRRRRRAWLHPDRPVLEARPFRSRQMPERLGELSGTGAQVLQPLEPAARAHLLEPVDRLERADQHGGADARAPRRPRSAARECRRSGRRRRCPGASNSGFVRGVRPAKAWQAGSASW